LCGKVGAGSALTGHDKKGAKMPLFVVSVTPLYLYLFSLRLEEVESRRSKVESLLALTRDYDPEGRVIGADLDGGGPAVNVQSR
jgi:hypothetical protein